MTALDGPARAARDAPSAVRHEIYWRSTEPVAPGPPLTGDVHCDVAVVGAGYTGLWTAYNLKRAEPSLDIHIVEAEFAGAGASGHNDGFVTPTIGHSLEGLVGRFGPERAKSAYALVGRSMLELGRFCKRHGVDAELEPSGYFQVAASPAQVRRLEADLRLAERLGSAAGLELYSAAEARDRIDSPAIHGAFKVGGSLINPHKLVRGLARVVRELGVTIHENTRATRVERTAKGPVVTTPHGRLSSDKLLLATNAYQHRFWPFRRKVVPVWSYAAVTEPLTGEQLAQVHWPGREGFVEARNFIVFGRFTADNRLLIGGGPAPYYYGRDMDEGRHMDNPSATAELRAILGRYFPQWRHLPFTHAYGGCVAITREFVPHVGSMGPDVYYAHGYCGNGIAVTHTTGKVLRDLMLGRRTAYTDLLFVDGAERGFPPEPLSFAGARAMTALMAGKDRFPGLLRHLPD
ncbi:NAD(P)/FAD-dependent oxidoreductase [Streptomyces boncukensis]|uniref:FAD-dependent oxidoreductase n=1 Tax=Streptomyces boncukensis TaxID=2711219 RepID=A0A6G4WQR5_9ACTN|nr:FAD-binding oxidoreductase [Streptomyces boncukensis]NGO66967.1 FAD-dependent oxidoreductase [Streptomyces boncukensis]